MPLHSNHRELFERLLLRLGRSASKADVLAYYDALAKYHGGDDDLIARALKLILRPDFAPSRRADDALERFIRDFDRPALVHAAAGILTKRWRAISGGAPLTGVSAKRALRLARTYEGVPASNRFTWAWLARPDGLVEAARLAEDADLGLDVLDPVFPALLEGDLDDLEVALIESLLLHASWIARRVLINQIGGVAHTPLLPALALASSSADPTTALALVGALGRIGHPAAEHPLVAILRKPDPGPDIAILEAMAELGSPTYLETIRGFAADGPDAATRAAATAAVDAIIERASLGGGALTLVDNGELTGALSPSTNAGAGALSTPGEPERRDARALAPRAAPRPESASSPAREPSPEDPLHAIVRGRVDEGKALTVTSERRLAESSWLNLAPAPRRVPRFSALAGSSLLTTAAGGLGLLLLCGALFHPVIIALAALGSPLPLLTLGSKWQEQVATPLSRARLLRSGLPTLAQVGHYDVRRKGYSISFVTDDNQRVEATVYAAEGDSRLHGSVQPVLYDPATCEADLFNLIEGVEIAPDGQLVLRQAAAIYRNISLSLLLAGVLAMSAWAISVM